jgi:terminase small subunit-like protein
MPALANPRHELFAQAVASGKSASEAYRQSGATGKNADVHAARLMVNDGISKRVAELKEAQSKKCEMTRDQLREFLVSVILAKPEDASFNNPLCEIAMTKEGPAPVFPNKLSAAAQLAELTGWNSVEKVSVETGDTLSEFLRQIVAK